MAAQREDQIDLTANAFHQTTDFRQVGRHIEGAIDGTNDVHARLFAFLARARLRLTATRTEFSPKPHDGAVSGLPLILINGAADEALQIAALRCDATANHFGDGTRHHHGGQFSILRGSGALQSAFRTVLGE